MRFTNFLHEPDDVKHPGTSRALPVTECGGQGTVWAGTAQRNETLEGVMFLSQKSTVETERRSPTLTYNHELGRMEGAGWRQRVGL